jgi:hypothetical protein
MTKEEGHLGSVFLPSSTEVNFLVDEKAHQRCRPRANTIFPPIPGSDGDQNHFHASIFFDRGTIIL